MLFLPRNHTALSCKCMGDKITWTYWCLNHFIWSPILSFFLFLCLDFCWTWNNRCFVVFKHTKQFVFVVVCCYVILWEITNVIFLKSRGRINTNDNNIVPCVCELLSFHFSFSLESETVFFWPFALVHLLGTFPFLKPLKFLWKKKKNSNEVFSGLTFYIANFAVKKKQTCDGRWIDINKLRSISNWFTLNYCLLAFGETLWKSIWILFKHQKKVK